MITWFWNAFSLGLFITSFNSGKAFLCEISGTIPFLGINPVWGSDHLLLSHLPHFPNTPLGSVHCSSPPQPCPPWAVRGWEGEHRLATCFSNCHVQTPSSLCYLLSTKPTFAILWPSFLITVNTSWFPQLCVFNRHATCTAIWAPCLWQLALPHSTGRVTGGLTWNDW